MGSADCRSYSRNKRGIASGLIWMVLRQILPFDVTIAGANEYGAMAAAKIFGVEIPNEGWGSSIDDAVSEMQRPLWPVRLGQ